MTSERDLDGGDILTSVGPLIPPDR
jgi:hypothetical protein